VVADVVEELDVAAWTNRHVRSALTVRRTNEDRISACSRVLRLTVAKIPTITVRAGVAKVAHELEKRDLVWVPSTLTNHVANPRASEQHAN
jgi:hypothetical protein